MDYKFFSKNEIISKVNILELTKEFQIKTEKISSGNFNYRCRCPSKEHKGGLERTGSCYIDSVRNKFHCFGCNAGSNCIDFYMLCSNCLFNEAIKELGQRNNFIISKAELDFGLAEYNNLPVLLEISNLLRDTILENKNDLKWINELMKKIDYSIFNLDPKDINSSESLLKKVKNTIKKRYNK